jgi:thiamine biosynthesis lipoprotein
MKKTIVLFLFFFVGCSKQENKMPTTFTGNQMKTDYKILIGDPLKEAQIEQIANAIDVVFAKVDQTFNKFNTQSELSKFNRTQAGEKFICSKELEDVVLFAKKMHELTQGRFDPTIEKLQSTWFKALKQQRVDMKKETETVHIENEVYCSKMQDFEIDLSAVLEKIGLEKVHIEKGVLYKETDGIEMDLNGCAKGKCVDLLSQAFDKLGIKNYFINWGGEIYAKGTHPQKRPWTALIRPITQQGKGIPVPLENCAIATSGDYFQNYTIGKKVYCHIFDPKTKKPLERKKHSIASASVVASNCMLADAIATSILLFENPSELNAFLEHVKQEYGVSVWILKRVD